MNTFKPTTIQPTLQPTEYVETTMEPIVASTLFPTSEPTTLMPTYAPTLDAKTVAHNLNAAKYGDPATTKNVLLAVAIPIIIFMLYIMYLTCRGYKMQNETSYREILEVDNHEIRSPR